MDKLYDIDAFFKGYKPSLLYNYTSSWGRYEKFKEDQLRTYPNLSVVIHDMEQVIYFQSKEMLKRFQDKIKGTDLDTPTFYKELGLALGFPPLSVRFYCDWLQDESLEWQRVSLEYCGICCVGAIKDIKENVEWFWKLPIPDDEEKDIKIAFTTELPVVTYYIEYNKTQHLQTAQDELKWIADKRKIVEYEQ